MFSDEYLRFKNIAKKSKVKIISKLWSEGCKVSIAELDSKLCVRFAQNVTWAAISCQFSGVWAWKTKTVSTRQIQIHLMEEEEESLQLSKLALHPPLLRLLLVQEVFLLLCRLGVFLQLDWFIRVGVGEILDSRAAKTFNTLTPWLFSVYWNALNTPSAVAATVFSATLLSWLPPSSSTEF